MKTSFTRILIALPVLLAVVGGFSPGSIAKKEKPVTPVADCSGVDNDTLISRVRLRISETPLLEGQNIQVQAEGRVITLTGNVSSVTKKGLAARTAGRVKCVKRVVNDLLVTPPFRPSPDAECCCNGICWIQPRPCPVCHPDEECLKAYKAAKEKAAGDRNALQKAWEAFRRCLCKKDN